MKQRLEQGQSFVEMAISFVFFLVIILGVLDVARIFYIYVALEDSAEAAAIYLAQHPGCETNTGGSCADPNNAEYRAKNSSSAQINWSGVDVDTQIIPAQGGNDAMVKVYMTYNFKLLTPVISNIVNSDTIVLKADATHVRLAN